MTPVVSLQNVRQSFAGGYVVKWSMFRTLADGSVISAGTVIDADHIGGRPHAAAKLRALRRFVWNAAHTSCRAIEVATQRRSNG